MALHDGLYDLLLTEGLEHLLSGLSAEQRALVTLSGGATDYLVDSLVRQLGALLEDPPGEGAEQAQRQLDLANELLKWMRQRLGETAAKAADGIDLIAPPARSLRAVQRQQRFPTPPELGLATPWLFTAGKGSPSLLQEIRRKLASSDRVDILVRARKGEPYRACGPVTLESAEGDRPMSITWSLRIPLPARLFREFSVLRAV